MRFKIIAALALAASLSVFAGTGAAQRPAQNPPPQPQPAPSDQGQPPSGNPPAPGQRPTAMMTPAMMQMMAPYVAQMMAQMGGPQDGPGRGPRPVARPGEGPGRQPGGPLQRVSRLLAALDDPRVRTMLSLTDPQADGLRKIVIDTETFTIKTGADIAVDSIDLRELLRADKPDKNAVMAKGDEISKDTSQLINRYLTAMLGAKAILTPEQQKTIRTYMESGAPAPTAPPALPRP